VKNFPSLRSNADFQRVYKNGKSYANKTLVMYVYGNNLDYNRIGISVSKKNGNSVVRHTFARKLREIFRLNKIEKKGLDIIVVVRVGADVGDYHKLESAYLHLLKSHRLDRENVEDTRIYFKKMKSLFDEISSLGLKNIDMKILSMGMSNDFIVAIEEGANLIRIGTSIFGKRDYRVLS